MEFLLIVFGLIGFLATLAMAFIGGAILGATARKSLYGQVIQWQKAHPGEGIPADELQKMIDKTSEISGSSSKRPW